MIFLKFYEIIVSSLFKDMCHNVQHQKSINFVIINIKYKFLKGMLKYTN